MDTADSPVDRVRVSSLAPSFGVRRIVTDYATVVRLQLLAEDLGGTLAGGRPCGWQFRNDLPLLLSHRGASAAAPWPWGPRPPATAWTRPCAAPLLSLQWQARTNARSETLPMVEAEVELGHVTASEFVAPPQTGDAVLSDLFLQAADARNENFFEPYHFGARDVPGGRRGQLSREWPRSRRSACSRTDGAAAPAAFADFYAGDKMSRRTARGSASEGVFSRLFQAPLGSKKLPDRQKRERGR